MSARDVVRWGLAALLLAAGIGHFAFTDEFLGQVPSWMPFPEPIVLVSGVVELVFAVALVAAPPAWRPRVGWALALFFVAVFPGNLWQAIDGTDTFGLDNDAERWIRLAFQPVLIVAALWSTGAWPRADRR